MPVQTASVMNGAADPGFCQVPRQPVPILTGNRILMVDAARIIRGKADVGVLKHEAIACRNRAAFDVPGIKVPEQNYENGCLYLIESRIESNCLAYPCRTLEAVIAQASHPVRE